MPTLTPQELAATFNATNVVVTVEEGNEDQFSYASSGPQTGTVTDTSGSVELGGLRDARSYVFTWVTGFGEESVPSVPSETVYAREGDTVLVEDLPQSYTSPDGQPRLVRGIRLYRSLATPGGTEFFRLATLWFPNIIVRAQQEGTLVTAETRFPHALVVGDKISVPSGVAPQQDAEVTEIIDRFRFKYSRDTSETIASTLTDDTFYYDVSFDPSDDEPFYWGLQNGDIDPYVFRDDFDGQALTTILPSLNYAPPPKDLSGIVMMPNNFMAGFSGKRVLFSEPNEFHAWPLDFALTIDENIVGLAVSSGTLVVLTEGYPYRIDGNTPETMTLNRIDSMYPCLSKESIVSTGMGVVYATDSGLALYSPSRGADRMTRFVLDRQDWQDFVNFDPASLRGFEYEDKYIGISSSVSFAFERDEQIGGLLVELKNQSNQPFNITAGWTDPANGNLYVYETAEPQTIREFDAQDPLPITWRSKRFRFPNPLDFGAFQIFGDMDGSVGYLETDLTFRGSMHTNTFVLTASDLDGQVGRMPTGGKFDEFEFELNLVGSVKTIRFATTPGGLRQV